MGWIIAAVAIGTLLIAAYAIGVERRNEWRMRERHIEARRRRTSGGDGSLEADRRTPAPKGDRLVAD